MARRRNNAFPALVMGLLLAACGGAKEPQTPTQPLPKLGLMTSLPLYWPLGAGVGELASGAAQVPWQREALEEAYTLVPLDTLSPIAALDPEAEPADPLEGLDQLAVIQPRVLTPADNVALDEWVRGGGQLLLVLDPALMGHYPLPLGDPRRPVEAALIPPVVERWGLELHFDDAQTSPREVSIAGERMPVALSGTLREIAGGRADCNISGEGVVAQCAIGEGQVTLFADAQVFHGEHSGEPHSHEGHASEGHDAGLEAGQRSASIQALVKFAFEKE